MEAEALGLDIGQGVKFEESEEDLPEDPEDKQLPLLPELEKQQGSVYEKIRSEARKASLAFFASDLLSGPEHAPYYGRFFVSDHHEEWSDLIALHKRLCILAPRDHGKSYMLTLAYPLWKAWKEPGSTGFIFSKTQDQAERILQLIREEIENNPRLAFLRPDGRKARFSARLLRLPNGSKIYARGFGTRVRGAHPHWIVVDDGLADEVAWSEVSRTRSIEYFKAAITNMIVPEGQIIVVGTPLHSLDLYGDLAKNEAYVFKRYQAIIDDGKKTERALWPERYSLEQLKARRIEITSILFTREFQCLPVSDDMSLFPKYLFDGPPVEQYQLRLGMPLEFWADKGIDIYVGVDFAISSNVQADYTVIWVMGVDRSGNRWIIDVIREQGLSYNSQKSLIQQVGMRYQPSLMYLESNAMQRIWGDQLIEETDLPIKKFMTTSEKNSLEKGIPSMRVLFESKKIRIPRGDLNSIRLTEIWKDEMHGFTFQKGDLLHVGEHKDCAMAAYICDQAIRQGRFSFSVGPREANAAPKEEAYVTGAVAAQNQLAGTAPVAQAQPERVSDVFTGEPIEENRWKPVEGAPVPRGGGWGRGY